MAGKKSLTSILIMGLLLLVLGTSLPIYLQVPSGPTSNVLVSSPPVQPGLLNCGIDEYQTPSGCWKSCDLLNFSQCPSVYNNIDSEKKICSFTNLGTYQNHPSECSACVILGQAFREGPCDCSFIKCKANQVCSEGKCIAKPQTNLCLNTKCMFGYKCSQTSGKCQPYQISCININCLPNQICSFGICIPKPYPSCDNVRCLSGQVCKDGKCVVLAEAKKTICSLPRPKEADCPTSYLASGQGLKFCGISYNGEKIRYQRECQACKNPMIRHYWNKPCSQIQDQQSTSLFKSSGYESRYGPSYPSYPSGYGSKYGLAVPN